MNRLLWILQIAIGLYFILFGVNHFVVPDGLPETLEWMYDLPDSVHVLAGTAEILGGLGLILPSVTRVRPELTPLAAAGLALVMASAAAWHASRGEWAQIAANVVAAGVLVFLAYGRWRSHPIEARTP